MNMTLEEYRLKSRKSDIYNSFWKICKSKLDEAIKNNEKICFIDDIPISEDDDTTFIMEILRILESSIKSIYNCDDVTYKFSTTSVSLSVTWNDDTVVPYKEVLA